MMMRMMTLILMMMIMMLVITISSASASDYKKTNTVYTRIKRNSPIISSSPLRYSAFNGLIAINGEIWMRRRFY